MRNTRSIGDIQMSHFSERRKFSMVATVAMAFGGLVLSLLPWLLAPIAFAQDTDDNPNALYYAGIDSGDGFYNAIAAVEQHYGLAVAAEIAAFVCAPNPDPECQGSEVDTIWIEFLNTIGAGFSVFETVSRMLEQDGDEALLTAIAVYWCSPDPVSGEGCGDDPATSAWNEFIVLINQGHSPDEVIAEISRNYSNFAYVGSAIAASVCGDPTCYAGSDDLAFVQPEQQVQAKPDVDHTSTSSSRRYVGKLKRSKSARSMMCVSGIVSCKTR